MQTRFGNSLQEGPATGNDLPPVIDRIAADVDELARARRVQDLTTRRGAARPRAERRRRLAGPDLEFRAFCTRRRLPAATSAGDAWKQEGTPQEPHPCTRAGQALADGRPPYPVPAGDSPA